MKKMILLTIIITSILMGGIIFLELQYIKDGYLSVEHAVVGDILLLPFLSVMTFGMVLLFVCWKKVKPFIVGLLSLILFLALFSIHILWGNDPSEIFILLLVVTLISGGYYIYKYHNMILIYILDETCKDKRSQSEYIPGFGRSLCDLEAWKKDNEI